jgi:hypothetical protein
MRDGWSQGDIGSRLGVGHSVVSEWATLADGGRVHPDSAEIVRILYGRIHVEDGPTPRVRLWAERRGWHPPEAWSADTIDDPAAEPYGWCSVEVDVDEVAVAQVEQGVRSWADLTDAEQRALVGRLVGTFAVSTLATRFKTSRARITKLAAGVAVAA